MKKKAVIREIIIFVGIVVIGYGLMWISDDRKPTLPFLFGQAFGYVFHIPSNIKNYFNSIIRHNPFGTTRLSILTSPASERTYKVGFLIFFYAYPLYLFVRLFLAGLKRILRNKR